MVQVSPNGKITILPLQTATLNQIARDQAAQLLDNLIEFEKVVGTTNLSTILNVADEGLGELSPLAVEPTSGDIIFKPVGDSVPAELMQAAEAMGGNLFIRIPASLLKQMWNREEVKFDQATFLDLLVYVQTKENDDGTTKQVFEQYHQKLSGEEYSKLIGMLKPQIAYIFNDLLLVKRYNVNIATLSNSKAYTEEYTSRFTGNTYKNYYEYLTAEEENASERNGTAAILGASFTNVNKSLDGSGGSVFYDTEIKLNPEYSVNGVAVTAQVEDTPAETYEETEEAEEAEETQKEPIADSNQPETVDDFLNALLNPQETAAPTAAPVSDIEAKKAELKDAIEQQKENLKKMTIGTPVGGIDGLNMGSKFDMGYKASVEDNQIPGDFDPNIADNDGDGYTIVTKIYEYGEMENGKMSKAPRIQVTTFNNKADADAYIEKQKAKIEEYKSKLGTGKVIDRIKKELAALEEETTTATPTDPRVADIERRRQEAKAEQGLATEFIETFEGVNDDGDIEQVQVRTHRNGKKSNWIKDNNGRWNRLQEFPGENESINLTKGLLYDDVKKISEKKPEYKGSIDEKIDKKYDAEVDALEGATQPTEQQEEDKPKKERRGPKSFNDFNVEEEEGRDIANRCNDDDSPF